MTKETRVGLLVGLVIVIVFGMILTEFKGTDAPFENMTAQPVVATEYYKTANPEQADLSFGPAPQQAEHAIHLASVDDPTPAAGQPIRVRVLPPRQVSNPRPVAAVLRRNIDEENPEPQLSRNPQPVQLDPPSNNRREVRIQLAQQDEEQVIEPVRPAPISQLIPATPAAPAAESVVLLTPPAAPAAAFSRSGTYRVVEGDTLSSIAAKVYGPDKRNLYKKIYDANRGRLSDASSIYVGQVLVIPDAGESNAPAGPNAVVAQVPSRASQVQQVDEAGLRQYAQQPHENQRRVYVVQSGDNLTRIARKMLNDGSRNAVDRLYQANKDKLQSPDSITEGMKLNIPS